MNPHIILGPPGTGKTTRLIGIVEDALASGVAPNKVGYISFTKKATNEAMDRACEKFGLKNKDLPHFRTLHSMAFRSLSLNRNQVMSPKMLKEFGELMGIPMRGYMNMSEGTVSGNQTGDRMLFLIGLARARCVDLFHQWQENPDDLQWFDVERTARGLEKYKQSRRVIDFTDMLDRFIMRGNPPNLDLLVVDEAQDLSKLQWDMVRVMAEHAKRVVIAGDDDQAIFQWAGADVKHFISMQGTVEHLEQSYRIPRKVQAVAAEVLGQIRNRRDKVWAPREADGSVEHYSSPEHIDPSSGSWLFLARNNYLLDEYEERLRNMGYLYLRGDNLSIPEKDIRAIQVWESLRKGGSHGYSDVLEVYRRTRRIQRNFIEEAQQTETFTLSKLTREWGLQAPDIWHRFLDRISLDQRLYLVAALKRGEQPIRTPRIHLSTIHGAKGGEADNVVLMNDMAPRTYRDACLHPDDERRVLYVGLTRARQCLHLIQPKTKYSFAVL